MISKTLVHFFNHVSINLPDIQVISGYILGGIIGLPGYQEEKFSIPVKEFKIGLCRAFIFKQISSKTDMSPDYVQGYDCTILNELKTSSKPFIFN